MQWRPWFGTIVLTSALLACSSLVCTSRADEPGPDQASPRQEMAEATFLDLVDKMDSEGLVLVTALGAQAVEAQARQRSLELPALGYWSPEGLCFSKTTPSECNGIFRR